MQSLHRIWYVHRRPGYMYRIMMFFLTLLVIMYNNSLHVSMNSHEHFTHQVLESKKKK